jgi:hypothetical protein
MPKSHQTSLQGYVKLKNLLTDDAYHSLPLNSQQPNLLTQVALQLPVALQAVLAVRQAVDT